MPTRGEWALKPSPGSGTHVAAWILREIWLTDSPKTLVCGSITASPGRMASRASAAEVPR